MNDGAIWPADYDLRRLDEVDSTLDEAARIAPGLERPTWIMAHRQLQGRARRGRQWTDPEGNLASTLVLFPRGSLAEAGLRSFVAALALRDALAAVIGGEGRAELALKWPNDVLLNGGKLAGILLESAGNGQGDVRHLAVGIGVNLVAAPSVVEDGALRPVSLLGETGVHIAPETFLVHLAAAFARREAQFRAGGFAAIRADWLAHATRIGEEITAKRGKVMTSGIFRTIDDAGNLVLETRAGEISIPAAEVFF
ncbi:biotin--[acetyl-CoA-carboxylase] ligase [Pontibaca methylaminivorans]|uniref:biotin--[biotin carboxyl-carrier protein] ligase n=1 Tax=Pontibaca methylaminivorans TaxID=515897 RepID=A0A1R3WF04_9RHOB|nr:biotin--[acetyl-CoA-carboxylase] ligase [Pontibaca methylaminivorans]SIT76432.1 BirA family transcriptional regulator, biotin operon repressor / biotin-[acetyl-CoA-carboxylase] ligase [Pontibaca methylaminivorans]